MMDYFLFAGYWFYPSGGWEDFVKGFPTLEEAHEAGTLMVETEKADWYHVLDHKKWELVQGHKGHRRMEV